MSVTWLHATTKRGATHTTARCLTHRRQKTDFPSNNDACFHFFLYSGDDDGYETNFIGKKLVFKVVEKSLILGRYSNHFRSRKTRKTNSDCFPCRWKISRFCVLSVHEWAKRANTCNTCHSTSFSSPFKLIMLFDRIFHCERENFHHQVSAHSNQLYEKWFGKYYSRWFFFRFLGGWRNSSGD